MLICPKCQSKNPQQNKFCQQCGTSLTQKACPECGTAVALNALNCPNCSTPVGTVWLAIVSRQGAQPNAGAVASETIPALVAPANSDVRGDNLDAPTSIESEVGVATAEDIALEEVDDRSPTEIQEGGDRPGTSDDPTADPTAAGETILPVDPNNSQNTEPLGSENIIENSNPEAALSESAEVNAENPAQKSDISEAASPIDAAPSQTTPLIPAGAFLDAQQRYQLLEPLPPRSLAEPTEVQVRVLDCNPFLMSPLQAFAASRVPSRSPLQPENPEAIARAIPQIAEPYLALGAQFKPYLPAIHDAWQQEAETVLLLEDRSDFDWLAEQWSDDDVHPMQILEWLYDMTELWAALEPWQCRQSLLEEANLRVNPDRYICLQRLYFERPDTYLEVQDFGEMWHVLFQKSQRTQIGSVTELLADLRQGQIQTVEVLRSRLRAIAEELEASSASVVEEDTDDDEDMPTIVLPMQLVGLEYAGRTDIGRQRDHNEDSFGIETDVKSADTPLGRSVRAKGLYILCDGMGGHASGEVASAMAVDTLRRYFQSHWGEQMPSEATIREAVLLANQAIYDVNQQEKSSGSGRMGTTLVLVLLENTQVAVAHVGDSRLYRLSRRHGLLQVTGDHEVGQREIQRGYSPEVAYSRPDAYQLTQALGPRDEDFIRPDVQFFDLNEDTLLILASDGLTDNNLLEANWKTHLVPLLAPDSSLTQGVDRLIELANQYNGHDNITAILIRALVKPSKI